MNSYLAILCFSVKFLFFFRNVYLCPFKASCLRLSAFRTSSIASFNCLTIWKRSNIICVVGKCFVKPDIKAGDMSIVACSICSGWTPLFSRCSFKSLMHVLSFPGVNIYFVKMCFDRTFFRRSDKYIFSLFIKTLYIKHCPISFCNLFNKFSFCIIKI